MTNDVDMEADNILPGRVTDIEANNLPDMVALQFTSPGDDIDSDDIAAHYVDKYSSTVGNLTGANFDEEEFNIALTNEDLIDSTLEPQNGGTLKVFFTKASIFSTGRKYMLALRVVDGVGNQGEVSNMVQIYLPPASTSTMTSTTADIPTTSPSSSGCSDNLLFATSSYPDGKLTCYDDEGFQLEKKEEKEENKDEKLLSPGTTCVFFSTGHVDTGGFIIEMFCQHSHWKVTLTQL